VSRRPIRYTLIVAAVAVGTALSAFGGWRFARSSAPLTGPIVLISIDTLRADHLPVYGYTRVKTPSIDALASDGVVFDRAYSHVPETLPSHVALLTGRLPFETGVRDDADRRLKPGERLLADMLHDRGYATGGVVSTSSLGKDTIGHGFDFFDEPQVVPSDLPGAPTERDGTLSEKIAERWLETIGTSRAFLFLQLDEPHKPYTPPAAYSQYAPYDGEIAYADEIVGRLVAYLKTHQLYDRATIILLSDHGEGLGDHGEQGHGLFVYQEVIHVPLIVKLEGNERAGQRVHDVVQHIDLVPTILDLVKASIPGTLRGRSLRPLLEGTGELPSRPVYAEALYGHRHFGWAAVTTLVDSRHQYISAPHDELYDLDSDPGERDNLAASDAVVRDSLKTALERVNPSADATTTAAADPKDKRDVLEAYRNALAAVTDRRWPQAIALFERVLDADPDTVEVWQQLGDVAGLMGRADVALDAYRHAVDLNPSDLRAYLGASDVLLRQRRLDDAAAEARAAAEAAGSRDRRSAAAAHVLLARIALAKRDPDEARTEARLAAAQDPSQPVVAYIDGRLLYDAGDYASALPLFERAIAAAQKPGAAPLEGLHLYAADTLRRLGRTSEAELELTEELRAFPHNVAAAVALVNLYQAGGRRDEAEDAVTAMLRTTPTPESYAAAARLWKTLGRPRRADALRTEAPRTFVTRR
jgi:choline-sulfatase